MVRNSDCFNSLAFVSGKTERKNPIRFPKTVFDESSNTAEKELVEPRATLCQKVLFPNLEKHHFCQH